MHHIDRMNLISAKIAVLVSFALPLVATGATFEQNSCSALFTSFGAEVHLTTQWTMITNESERQWGNYERTEGGSYRFGLRALGQTAFKLLKVENLKNKKILDAGCGNGKMVAEWQRSGVNAVGVDIALSKSQKRKSYFYSADVRDTPFPNATFDVITSLYNVFSYPEVFDFRLQVMKELSRITKPNGHIIIVGYRALSEQANNPVPEYFNSGELWDDIRTRLTWGLEPAKRELQKLIDKVGGIRIIDWHLHNDEVTVVVQRVEE